MKNLLIACFLVFTASVSAQEVIGQYSSEYSKKTFDVSATEPKDGEYSLYIDMWSLDASVENGGIIVKSNNIEVLKNFLIEVKGKYIEWTELAKTNGVNELDKDMPTNASPKAEGYFRYGSWKFDRFVKLRPRYFLKGDNTLALIHTGEMTASDNQYIDAKDFVFAFSNVKEIDDFIALLDEALVIDHFSKKNNTESLFN